MARAILVLSAILVLCREAAADPESVHIDYQGPSSCPDAAAFMRSLQARTTRFRLTPDEGRRFLVRVTVAGSGFAGRLDIRDLDGRTATRTVDGTVCDEVVEALALMTALAIDPNALTTVPKGSGKNPGNPAAKTTGQENSQRPPDADVAPPSSPTASQPWRWSAGVLGHMTSGLSPNLGYGGQLFVDAEAPDSSRLGPAARAGVFLNQSDRELPTGAARFQWALAMVEGCPARLAMGQRLAVHPCLSLHFGALRGEGRRISLPKQTVGFWADLGPVLRVGWAVTARLILEAQGALVAPLYRRTFEITDMGTRMTAYTVPRLGGWVGMGLSYRFR